MNSMKKEKSRRNSFRLLTGALALVAALVLTTALITGCSNGGSGGSSNTDSPQTDSPPQNSIQRDKYDTAYNCTYLSQVEIDIIHELNKLRADPVAWCKANGLTMLDGLTPEEEFLQDKNHRGYNTTWPHSILYPTMGMWLAAYDNNFNCETAKNGKAGHTEWDGRLNNRYGHVSNRDGECAGSQGTDGAAIVAGFVRDSGVSDKGHRKNCVDAGFNNVGAANSLGIVTIDFADSFTDFATPPCTPVDWGVKIVNKTGSYDAGGKTITVQFDFSKDGTGFTPVKDFDLTPADYPLVTVPELTVDNIALAAYSMTYVTNKSLKHISPTCLQLTFTLSAPADIGFCIVRSSKEGGDSSRTITNNAIDWAHALLPYYAYGDTQRRLGAGPYGDGGIGFD
jgi:hypothetical protein